MLPEKRRVQWIDYAKGLSIILVVSTHSMFAELDSTLYSDNLFFFNNIIVYIRMPLFFFISGLFIHKAMTCDRETFIKLKISNLLYLYILWSVIVYVTKTLPDYLFFQYSDLTSLENILTIFYAPTGMLWFIYALAIFIVVTRLIKSAPIIALSISVLLYLFIYEMGVGGFLGDRLITNYPFFLSGYILSNLTLRAVNNLKPYYLIMPVVYLALVSFISLNSLSIPRVGEFILSLSGIAAGIIAVVFLSRFKCFSWLGYVGRNTLPIYVMHYLPVGLLRIILPELIPNRPYLAAVIMISTSVVFPLVFLKVTRKLNVYWPFQIPPNLLNKIGARKAVEKST